MNLFLALLIGLIIGFLAFVSKFFHTTEVCKTTECNSVSARISQFMDTATDPCDNFHKFVCGNYHGNEDSLKQKIHNDLKTSIQKISEKDDKFFQNVKSYYNSCIQTHKTKNPNQINCIEDTIINLPLGVHALYVRLLNENAKKNVEKILENVVNSTESVILGINQDKVNDEFNAVKDKVTKYFISHPDEILNNNTMKNYYQDLNLDASDFEKNEESIEKFTSSKERDKLKLKYGNFLRLDETITKYYDNRENNEYYVKISSGKLQKPYYYPDGPNYLNYGALGSIIAIKIFENYIDKLNIDNEKLKFHRDCLLNKLKEQHKNEDKNELNDEAKELIAIEGGVKTAYKAYEKWQESIEKNEPQLSVSLQKFSPSQMFWIIFAHRQCNKYKSFSIVNKVLENVEEFSEDFYCSKPSSMNPIEKCLLLE